METADEHAPVETPFDRAFLLKHAGLLMGTNLMEALGGRHERQYGCAGRHILFIALTRIMHGGLADVAQAVEVA